MTTLQVTNICPEFYRIPVTFSSIARCKTLPAVELMMLRQQIACQGPNEFKAVCQNSCPKKRRLPEKVHDPGNQN